MTKEPIAWTGAVSTLAAAVVAVIVGFGVVHWTTEQVGLVLGLVAALIGCVTIWQRSKVTPV